MFKKLLLALTLSASFIAAPLAFAGQAQTQTQGTQQPQTQSTTATPVPNQHGLQALEKQQQSSTQTSVNNQSARLNTGQQPVTTGHNGAN